MAEQQEQQNPSATGDQQGEPVIADKTVEVEVEDPNSGSTQSFRIVAGTQVPAHLVEAYNASGGKGGKSKKVDAPDKDK